ncbi:transcription factor WhiB [Salmonella enterica subsp. enterica serovar Javiana]|nr:transcription factor WhiB [Salmonella enterica subsp. enterica serovar Javiana]
MASIKRLPAPLLSSYEWQTDGACRTTDPNEFFPAESERGNRRLTREQRAKALCSTCPVVKACFEHAMAVQEPYGVWGGTTPEERAQLRGSIAS